MTSRVVGLVVVVATAVAVLGACNLREGDGTEYNPPSGAPAPAIDGNAGQRS